MQVNHLAFPFCVGPAMPGSRDPQVVTFSSPAMADCNYALPLPDKAPNIVIKIGERSDSSLPPVRGQARGLLPSRKGSAASSVSPEGGAGHAISALSGGRGASRTVIGRRKELLFEFGREVAVQFR